MLVRDVYPSLVGVTGMCSQDLIYTYLTLAVELLSNEGQFDPLIATIDFYVDGAYLLALPRDVKTVQRININNSPSFARNRIYEFSQNGQGSVDGSEGAGNLQWHERGYSVIQDETHLPSRLQYQVTQDADVNFNCTIYGIDPNGREIKETIQGAEMAFPITVNTFAQVTKVVRDATTGEAYLLAKDNAGASIARYYPDETEPSYRVIKLSQTGVAVRMIYRKNTFAITSQDDVIPLQSKFAVIQAVQAVRLMLQGKSDDAAPYMAAAVDAITKEQNARNEGSELSQALEIQSAINANITTSDLLIVADIYDDACMILGNVGRSKVFDSITDAVEALQQKSQWDSMVGELEVAQSNNYTTAGCRENYGLFVLPRSIGAVLAVNLRGLPIFPRNRWYEFHQNGSGGRQHWVTGAWDDKGETPIINFIPWINGQINPIKLLAVPENGLDVDATVMVYGYEKWTDGTEREVYRNGALGYLVPCKQLPFALPADGPQWTKIDRITRTSTTGFVSLNAYPVNSDPVILMGLWQPDELAPTYRMLRVNGGFNSRRIRIRYRKRTNKISSLYDVINLRSRLAIINMLRAISKQDTDPQSAVINEEIAIGYLEEEQIASNPHIGGSLQMEASTAPGSNFNIF